MAQHYIAVPRDHTVIHLSLLQVLTYTMQVYNRLIATGHANLVQQAVMGFPSTPETSNKKEPIPCKTEVKTENPNRTSSSPKPSPESIRKSHANRRVFFSKKPQGLGTPLSSQRTPRTLGTPQRPIKKPQSQIPPQLQLSLYPSHILSAKLSLYPSHNLSAQIPLTPF